MHAQKKKYISSTLIDGTVMLQHSLKTFYLLNKQLMLFFEQAPAISIHVGNQWRC